MFYGYILSCFLSKEMVSKWPASCFLACLGFEQSYISWSSHLPGGEKKMQGRHQGQLKEKGKTRGLFCCWFNFLGDKPCFSLEELY